MEKDPIDNTSFPKGKGINCSPLMVVFTTFTVGILITATALMTYYIPLSLEANPTKAPVDPTIPLMRGRLPKTVLPRLYQLTLRPFLYDDDVADSKLGKRFTFDGLLTIRVECIEPTDEITLHAKDITFHASPTIHSVSSLDKTTDLFESYEIVEEYAFIVIKLKKIMDPHQEYSIYMEYSGILGDDEAGFYPSKYYDASNNTKYIATTQMEGPYARRVLPCFDEPSFKATYEVQLEHRTNMKALSNGLETGTETIDSRWSKTKFTTVHFMPTYLLAFIVHDYSSIQLTNTNGCLIRVWCPSHQISYADYALNISNLVQTYFDSYLDYEYPLAKEDHIAIQDFGAGAMENWGLITYQDFYLLHELDDSVSKTFYSLIITHELAHMWFGNLVTMEWWNDLWLNEGFATYMEHIGMNLVHPEFRRTETYYVNTVDRALKPDSLGTMPSVRAPVYANDKHISSQFSRITYQKGGSLLWMLEHLLTLDVFNAGIKSYLKERSYKNANAEHLWRQLTAADKDKGGLDIKKIMDTWTLQRGYPLVTLKRSTDGRVIEATQEIFLQLGENLEEEEFGDLGYKWWVPLTYLYKSGPSDKYDNPAMDWLDPSVEKTSIQLTGAPSTEWYLANAKMTGYYRVNYDETNWQRLLDQAAQDPNAFSEENKIGLLYDSESLAKAEIISMDIYKGFAQSFENNTLISQQAVLRTSSYFAKMLTRPSYGMKRRSLSNPSAAAQTYMQRLVEPLYVDSGWDENFMPDLPLARYETMDQFDITSTACQYGHEHCVSKATALFKEYVENPKQNTIPKNFRKVVYCNGIRFGGKVEWDFAFDMLQASDDRWERSRWISALACSADHSRLKRYLQSMLDTATYSRHDDALILMGVAQNPDGYEVAWEFVRNNWETVGKMFKRNNQLLRDVLEEITSNFNTNEKLQELLDFGEGRDLGAMKVAYDSAVVTTKVNIRWMANKAAETEQWIASRIQ